MRAYRLGLYEKAMPHDLDWRQKMLAAKAAGYDYIEISIDESDEKLGRLDMSKDERKALVDLMSETGMPIRSMCLSGHRKYPLGSSDPATNARGMEIMEKAIELAEDLGVRTIQIAGYDVYYEKSNDQTRALFEENLEKSVRMAARSGVILGFETMETEFMNTVGKAMHYVDLINSAYLTVYPDAGNITNAAVLYGTDVCADLKTGAGHICALHLKETVPGVFREVPFGEGHVDFPALIDCAWSLGVRRYVTELWYTGNPAWRKELQSVRSMMGALLDREE